MYSLIVLLGIFLEDYRNGLETSVKQAHKWNVQIPESLLISYNKELLRSLNYDKQTSENRIKAKGIFTIAKNINSQLSCERGLNFSKEYQLEKNEKFHKIPSDWKIVLNDGMTADVELPGLRNLISLFLDMNEFKNKDLLKMASQKIPSITIHEALKKGKHISQWACQCHEAWHWNLDHHFKSISTGIVYKIY